ncbi:MAG TPA: hypothetical protein VNV41_20260 [Candidatus Acidoferrales bacterium]|jgi:hypothetical protein|nr:hypothetical protein [Candidatus Acidoferrales bacterium]
MNDKTLQLKIRLAKLGVVLSMPVLIMGIVLAVISLHTQRETIGVVLIALGTTVMAANTAALARLKKITPTT